MQENKVIVHTIQNSVSTLRAVLPKELKIEITKTAGGIPWLHLYLKTSRFLDHRKSVAEVNLDRRTVTYTDSSWEEIIKNAIAFSALLSEV